MTGWVYLNKNAVLFENSILPNLVSWLATHYKIEFINNNGSLLA